MKAWSWGIVNCRRYQVFMIDYIARHDDKLCLCWWRNEDRYLAQKSMPLTHSCMLIAKGMWVWKPGGTKTQNSMSLRFFAPWYCTQINVKFGSSMPNFTLVGVKVCGHLKSVSFSNSGNTIAPHGQIPYAIILNGILQFIGVTMLLCSL